MAEDLISVIELARQLGRRKTTIFKILNRLSIAATKQRSQANAGQLISYITSKDAKRVAEDIASSELPEEGEFASPLLDSERGVFYLIQLEPSHDPERFKVGFAAALPERLRQHRCSAPFAKVLQTWPCKRLWEKTAIDSVTQDCERLHTEVFRAKAVHTVVARCNQFFALMPPLGKDGATSTDA